MHSTALLNACHRSPPKFKGHSQDHLNTTHTYTIYRSAHTHLQGCSCARVRAWQEEVRKRREIPVLRERLEEARAANAVRESALHAEQSSLVDLKVRLLCNTIIAQVAAMCQLSQHSLTHSTEAVSCRVPQLIPLPE